MPLVTPSGDADAVTLARVKALIDVAESDEDQGRRAQCAQRIRVYDGEAQHLVRMMPAEDPAHFRAKPKLTPPLLTHSLRQISFIYDIPPHRLSGQSDEWEKMFWGYGGGGFDSALHSGLPLAKLCGQVHAWYRTARSPFEPVQFLRTEEGRTPLPDDPGVVTDLWTSDQVVALENPFDARHAQALALFGACVGAPSLDLGKGKAEIWHYLDEEWYGQLWHNPQSRQWRMGTVPDPETGRIVNLVPHGQGMLPVQSMPWVFDPAQKGYWVKPWAGADLLDNLAAIYSQLTEYMWTARLQRGQPVGRGVTDLPLGPDHMVMLSETTASDFTIIPNNANLAGMLESVTASLSLLAKTLGLPSRTFRIEDTAAMSGIAIVLDRGELEDQRRGDEQTWRRNEAVAHQIVARLMSVRDMADLSPDVTTAYTPLAPVLTQEQLLATVELERREGSMSLREMKQTLHRDLPDNVVDVLLEAAAIEGASGADVARQALNGAQVTALQGILESVALGALAPEAALIAIQNAFPTIDENEATKMVRAAASTPRVAEPQAGP
jgi:hypothetical protein